MYQIIPILISIVSALIAAFSAYYTWRTVQIQARNVLSIIDVTPQLSEDWSRYAAMAVTSDGQIQGEVSVSIYPYLGITARIDEIPDNWNVVFVSKGDVNTYPKSNILSFPRGYYEFNIPVLPADDFFNIYCLNMEKG